MKICNVSLFNVEPSLRLEIIDLLKKHAKNVQVYNDHVTANDIDSIAKSRLHFIDIHYEKVA